MAWHSIGSRSGRSGRLMYVGTAHVCGHGARLSAFPHARQERKQRLALAAVRRRCAGSAIGRGALAALARQARIITMSPCRHHNVTSSSFST